MSRRTFRAGLVGSAAALITMIGTAAQADPVPDSPGTPIPGKTDAQLYAAVGADAFAELTNYIVSNYNAQVPAPDPLLESYDAVNPATGVAGETITTKPGCSVVRPNGANGGLSLILKNTLSTNPPGDGTSYCVDWVRSSRPKKTDGTEAGLDFYAQSQDAVSYAVVGNAYAPTTPLTTAQLKSIFECAVTDWSQVGGQPGPIHVYMPPTTAATLTFFLTAIGSDLTAVHAGCGDPQYTQQQNDGRTMNGDPLGIAPYAVTKWAAQSNGAPGIADNRGGTHVGEVDTAVAPLTQTTVGPNSYEVLNPAFTAANASYARLFYNVVRHTAPQSLKDVFKAGGYLCQHQNAFLIPFGNTPLGDDTNADRFCGQVS